MKNNMKEEIKVGDWIWHYKPPNHLTYGKKKEFRSSTYKVVSIFRRRNKRMFVMIRHRRHDSIHHKPLRFFASANMVPVPNKKSKRKY